MAIIGNAPIRDLVLEALRKLSNNENKFSRSWREWTSGVTKAIKQIFPSLKSTPNYVWQSLSVGAGEMEVPVAGGADWGQVLIPYGGNTEYGYFPQDYIPLESTAGSFWPYNSNFGYFPKNNVGAATTNLYTWLFNASTEESSYFIKEVPRSWNKEGTLNAYVRWMKTTAAAGDVVWGLEYSFLAPGADANPVQVGTSSATPTIVQDTQWGHQLSTLVSIAPPEDALEGSVLVCRLFRDATDASDDYGADAALLTCGFNFRAGKIGTGPEYPS